MILAQIGIKTNDVVKMAQFYKDVLNTTTDCDDTVHQAVQSEGIPLAIYNDGTEIESINNNVVIAFTVEDVDKEYDRLVKMNIKIKEPPTTRPWGARNMIFEDPDGNEIIFRSFPVG
jgi:predicted enzyme related to lactoylglutathione lyase